MSKLVGGSSLATQPTQDRKRQTQQNFLIQTKLWQSDVEFFLSCSNENPHTPHNLFNSTRSSPYVKTRNNSESSPKNLRIQLPVLKVLLKACRPIFLLPNNSPRSHLGAIAKFGPVWATICTGAHTPRQGGPWCCSPGLNWAGGLENMRLADAWPSHLLREGIFWVTVEWFLQPSVSSSSRVTNTLLFFFGFWAQNCHLWEWMHRRTDHHMRER